MVKTPYVAINVDNTLGRTIMAGEAIPADLPVEFYLKHLKQLYYRMKPYEGAVETLNQIAQRCGIVYTTARPRAAGFVTMRWLAVNGFPAGALVFIPPDKRYFPDSAGVIDDDPRVPALYPPEWASWVCVKAQPYNKAASQRFDKWSNFLDMLQSAFHKNRQ